MAHIQKKALLLGLRLASQNAPTEANTYHRAFDLDTSVRPMQREPVFSVPKKLRLWSSTSFGSVTIIISRLMYSTPLYKVCKVARTAYFYKTNRLSNPGHFGQTSTDKFQTVTKNPSAAFAGVIFRMRTNRTSGLRRMMTSSNVFIQCMEVNGQ